MSRPTKQPPRLMQPPPGARLGRWAQRLVSPQRYTYVLEPVLSDLAEEHAIEVSGGRFWRSRYVRIRGYLSFWLAVAGLTALSVQERVRESATRKVSKPTTSDRYLDAGDRYLDAIDLQIEMKRVRARVEATRRLVKDAQADAGVYVD